ncbi:helix-turn-helix domain-containing protein [Paenibacillus arenilitoris]
MLVHKAYKFRIYPNKAQATRMSFLTNMKPSKAFGS